MTTDAKAPPAPNAAPPAALPPDDPAARIAALQDSIKALDAEIRILEGKIANRNAAVADRFSAENADLKKRFERLRRCLHALHAEASPPVAYETLKQAALDYFKIANVDPELWKNLAS